MPPTLRSGTGAHQIVLAERVIVETFVTMVEYSRDFEHLFVLSDKVKIYETKTMELVITLDCATFIHRPDTVMKLDPTGNFLFVLYDDGPSVVIDWRNDCVTCTCILDDEDDFYDALWSRSRKIVYIMFTLSIMAFDVSHQVAEKKFHYIYTAPDPLGWIVTHDEHLIVSDPEGSFYVTNLMTWEEKKFDGVFSGNKANLWCTDSTKIVCFTEHDLRIFDWPSFALLKSIKNYSGGFPRVVFSKDVHFRIGKNEKGIHLHNMHTDRHITSKHIGLGITDQLSLSDNGQYLMAVGRNGTVTKFTFEPRLVGTGEAMFNFFQTAMLLGRLDCSLPKHVMIMVVKYVLFG